MGKNAFKTVVENVAVPKVSFVIGQKVRLELTENVQANRNGIYPMKMRHAGFAVEKNAKT